MPNTPVPSNISLGTYVQDGVRSGPLYTGTIVDNVPTTILGTSVTNTFLKSNYYNKYGPSVLYSPQNTWNITPNPRVSNGNIVTFATISGAGDLPLSGDGQAATLLTDSNGNPYIQFDWPRVPGVYLNMSITPSSVSLTIFGTDWYGLPLQHTYDIQSDTFYPSNAHTDLNYDLGSPCKAFYTITRVHASGSIPPDAMLLVETTNIFGLPYKINDTGNILNFSWAGTDMMDQKNKVQLAAATAIVNTQAASLAKNNIFLTYETEPSGTGNLYVSAAQPYSSFTINSTVSGDTSTVNWLIKDGGLNLIKLGDSTPATADTTYDVRGLVQIPDNVPPLDGTKSLIVTSYIYGADQFINQLAAMGKTSGVTPTPIKPLTAADLYGVPQYYTGVPT